MVAKHESHAAGIENLAMEGLTSVSNFFYFGGVPVAKHFHSLRIFLYIPKQ